MSRYISMALLALSPIVVPAQVNKSSLTGVVRDSSGGAIGGAVVRIINQDTQVPRAEVTDSDGKSAGSRGADKSFIIANSRAAR